MREIPIISTFELKKRVEAKAPFLLIETLAPERFAQGHLPGAINIPPEKMGEVAARLLPDRRAEIITYCSGPG
jgi:sulfur-carrier protein adenylyltransferase/sulfurtransferase